MDGKNLFTISPTGIAKAECYAPLIGKDWICGWKGEAYERNLYCVGRNGQHRYNNIDHSMVTSFETVKNILSGEKDKTNIWSVNTEKEYHEEAKQNETEVD